MTDTHSEGHDFASSFYNANLGLDVEEISSPAFPTSFLSTQWLFVLQLKKDVVCINLRRADHCGPDEAVHVILKDRFFQNVWQAEQTEPLPCSFNKGDTVEILNVKNNFSQTATLIRIVINPKRDVIRVKCTLLPDFQKYSHMYELSRNMCSLFTNPKFSDVLLCADDSKREAHRSILSVRTPNLKITGKSEFNSNTAMVKFRTISKTTIEQLSKFAYSAHIDTDLNSPEDKVLIRAAKYLGISNFEANIRDIAYSESATNLKFKRSYINATCDYSKLMKKRDIQKFDFTAFKMRWNFQCLFSKGDGERNKTIIKVTCNRLEKFETLTVRYIMFVICSCMKLLTSSVSYRNVPKSQKRFLLSDYCKDIDKDQCCSVKTFHFYIDIWAGITDDFVECGRSKYMRDTLSDILDLGEDLQKLLDTGNYSDATIKLHDGEVEVHRAILSARSPVFERMFDSDMRESTEREIEIVDFEKDVMKKLLRYIYTARVSFLENAETIQLAYAAEKYETISLKEKCLKHLCDNIDKNSVLDIYTLFDRLQADDEHKNRVLKYIEESFCAACDKNELENWKELNPHQYFAMFKRTCSCAT